MNYSKKIFELLNIEQGQRFTFKGFSRFYYFDKNLHLISCTTCGGYNIRDILLGTLKIEQKKRKKRKIDIVIQKNGNFIEQVFEILNLTPDTKFKIKMKNDYRTKALRESFYYLKQDLNLYCVKINENMQTELQLSLYPFQSLLNGEIQIIKE